MSKKSVLVAFVYVFVAGSVLQACSICGIKLRTSPTMREDSTRELTKYIILGQPIKANLDVGLKGSTTVKVLKEIKQDTNYRNKKEVVISRYIPANPSDPKKFLIFADILPGNRLDAYRGIPIKSADVIDYIQGGMKLDPKKPKEFLGFYFRYLEHADPEIARDAFINFAKAADIDINDAASVYSAEKLRRWLTDPRTEVTRLGVYALLLGSCGSTADAALIREMLSRDKEDRIRKAYDGLLSGYLSLRPEPGWNLLYGILRDGTKSLQLRFAAVRALRYAYGARPKENKQRVLRGLSIMIEQGELADMAIEDLRQAKIWDLTNRILSLYGKKGFTAPLMKQAIVRYALTAPKSTSVLDFIADRRKSEADLVEDIEEQLRFER